MGAFRFLLAALVVISHFGGSDYVAHFGFYAVRCFFVLSGFVMTAALHDVYHFDGRRFFANRLLRLLPLYYAACALTLVLVRYAPEQAALFTPHWRLPDDPFEILMNLLLLPQISPYLSFRLLMPAWSLAVEMVMYGFLFLAVARSERAAWLFFLLGVAYHAWLLATGAAFSLRYFTITSVLISFPLGSLVYFWKCRGAVTPTSAQLPVIFLAWAANVFIGPSLSAHYADDLGYYLNTILSGLLVAAIFELRMNGFWAKLDGWLGELSYPIFLVHWIGGFIVFLCAPHVGSRGWAPLLVALPVILSIAMMFALLQRWLIDPVRTIVREQAKRPQQSALSPNGGPSSAARPAMHVDGHVI